MFAVAYAFVYALALVQLGLYGSALPDQIATHFAAGGAPTGWMTREGFIVFYLALLAAIPGVFLAVAVLVRRLRAERINLPNKDYWLAPERREATLRTVAAGLRALGLFSGLMLIAAHQFVIEANLLDPPRLDPGKFGYFLCAAVACPLAFIVWLRLKFRLPH